jgi:hypothetical protein
MPKENTHLFFAHELSEKFGNEQIKSLVKKNLRFFYFGSVVPDTFYYGHGEAQRKISEYLHGRYGNLTSKIVFEMLDKAKRKQSEKDLVFIFGYLTHCALDITFHPMVYYLSGNYYNPNPSKAADAIYLHRHLETYLDHEINDSFNYNDLIDYRKLRGLIFSKLISKKFNISIMSIERILKNKALFLRFIKNDFILSILYLLYRPKFYKYKMFLGLFYGNLKRDKRGIPKVIDYRDIITGVKLQTTIEDLFERSYFFAEQLIIAANDYYSGKLTHEQAAVIIRGESLNTGRVNMPVTKIKYYYNT